MDGHFTTIDFVVLAFTLLISAVTGIFFAFRGRHNDSTDSYFYGDRKSSPIVVGMSLAVSFISGTTIIGYPVELYLHGTVWFWLIPCFPIAVTLTCFFLIPIYFKLKLNCVYEYLELRFCKFARILSSVFTVSQLMFYMSVILCYPALSLTALTPIPLIWSVTVTSVICTFYTVIGGFLSVIWTDVFQAFIMFIGSMAVLVQGTIAVGGPGHVLEVLERGNRSTLWDFDTDLTKQSTAWSVLTGNVMTWVMTMTINQADVQRYLSCKNVREGRKSIIIAMIPQIIITTTSVAVGAVAYAHFEHCDPVLNNEIKQNDQMVPLLVAKLTKDIPGLSGMFVAAIYCGTLSTVSSGINSCTLIIMEDFVFWRWTNLTQKRKGYLCKAIGVILGTIVCTFAISITMMRGTLVQIGNTITSFFTPPIAGMFTLGLFIPWANSTGALVGSISSFIITVWLAIGSLFYRSSGLQALERMTDECADVSNANSTQSGFLGQPNATMEYSTTIYPQKIEDKEYTFYLYEISYLYLRLIGYVLTVIIGVIVSFVTGASKPENMNPRLFVPIISSKIFPENIRKFWRLGVPEYSVEILEISEEKNMFLKNEEKL